MGNSRAWGLPNPRSACVALTLALQNSLCSSGRQRPNPDELPLPFSPPGSVCLPQPHHSHSGTHQPVGGGASPSWRLPGWAEITAGPPRPACHAPCGPRLAKPLWMLSWSTVPTPPLTAPTTLGASRGASTAEAGLLHWALPILEPADQRQREPPCPVMVAVQGPGQGFGF